MKNPYGLNKSGDVVYVDDVERGLACECVCPLCHKPFRACQGEKNEHYFAHQDASECEFSYRASLLRMVVDYLRSGELEIPAVVARFMTEESLLRDSETVAFDRIEQHGDMHAPELRCYLGERSWVLKPLFDNKDGRKCSPDGTCLILDLTQFSNPYASRPDQNLKPTLQKQRLLKWRNYPGIEAREFEMRESYLRKMAEQRAAAARAFTPHQRPVNKPKPRPVPTPEPVPRFQEDPLPCKFCKKVIPPRDTFMTARSEGYCVCRACNKERGGNIWGN